MGHDLSGAALAPAVSPAEEAAEAIRLVLAEPRRARALAERALRRAVDEGDSGAASTAERALGLVAKEVRKVDAAVAHFRRAIELAEGAGLDVRAAEARMSLSLTLAYRGETRQGLREADRAARVLRGEEAARLQMQRALILQRLGRADEALEGYRRALQGFRRSGDTLWEARLLNNRGLLHAYRGSLAAAEGDLAEAERLHLSLGQELAAAEVRHNRGFVCTRRGDAPAALAWFDLADDYFRANGVPRAMCLADRCQLLLSVRLVAEGRRAAEQAVEELARTRVSADLAEARLMLSEAALLDGDTAVALREADEARRAFVRQRRRPWAVLAAYASLRAAWLAGDCTPATLATARRLRGTLAEAGWPLAALDAGVIAGRIALECGRPDEARRELERAARARGRGPVELRVRAWHAEALLRHERGRPHGVSSALRAGLRLLERHRAVLGATELRAHVSSHAAELAAFGVRVALERRDPAQVLAWAERWRAGSITRRRVRPPRDPLLAADLEELRRVAAEADEAALSGRDAGPALRRQVALEARIRSHTRRARGDGSTALVSPPTPAELGAALGERVLVEYVQSGDELYAVTVGGGRARLRRVGAPSEAAGELESLRFALRRLARTRVSERSSQAADGAARHAAARLEELLLAPLAPELGDGPLVVVPTGALHALPWGMLPSGFGRPITVAPSAAVWLRATQGQVEDDRGGVVLAAGPGLAGAAAEVLELAQQYPAATVLVGESARAMSVQRSLDGVALAHVAAHGSFRADNPLFSSLRCADGPLTVYDLESLRRAPRTLVLSACDSGLSDVRPGDELMGLAAALFALGTSTVIAGVIAVPDEATVPLMAALHRNLALGQTSSVALAQAQVEVGDRRSSSHATAGFVNMGAG